MVPAKFISLMLHLLVVTMNYFSYVLLIAFSMTISYRHIPTSPPSPTHSTLEAESHSWHATPSLWYFWYSKLPSYLPELICLDKGSILLVNFASIQPPVCISSAPSFGHLTLSSSGSLLKFGPSGSFAGKQFLISVSFLLPFKYSLSFRYLKNEAHRHDHNYTFYFISLKDKIVLLKIIR